jgi:adenylosuccinate lyase
MIHQSLIYRDKFGSASMREVWSEESMVQRWLDTESAIAWAQGELGIIPRSVARKIARGCTVKIVRPAKIAELHRQTGHVIVSLVKTFREAVREVGEMFHFGPTSQDILDTGLTLQTRHALRVLVPSLLRLHATVLGQSLRYRKTIMAGRTEGQLASPVTLGHKLAVLGSELLDHLDRLSQATERLMWVTLFGATGVQSSFCQIGGMEKTKKLVRLVGTRLGLKVPTVCLHHRTDRFAELGFVLAGILSTLGEAGLEIRDLQRSEVREVAEPWADAQHSSSTMPQKQNPEMSEWLEGLAKLGRGYALSLMDIQQQHERDITRLPPELHALPNLFLHTAAAVESANAVFGRLRVFPQRMRRNLMSNGGLIMAEAVMLLLARRSRRKVWAHQLCHDIAMEVAAKGGDFIDTIAKHREVRRYLSAGEIKAIADPGFYTGTAISQVEVTARKSRARRRVVERSFRKSVFAAPT